MTPGPDTMRSLRLRFLQGSAPSHTPAPARARVGPALGGPPSNRARDQLVFEVHPHGLVGTRHDGSVPALVPWASVRRVSVGEPTPGRRGRVLRTLEIELTDDGWLGGARWRFVGSEVVVLEFAQAVAAARAAGAPSASPGRLAVLRAAVARHLPARTPGDPETGPGLGSRPLGALAGALAVLVLAAGGAGSPFPTSASGAPQRAHVAASHAGNRAQAAVHPTADLAAATSTPAPAPPSLAGAPPLQSHEIFGYAPYWTLPQSSGFDVNNLTTLAYFSVDANPDGTLSHSGPGWNGYQSQDLVNLVNRAHAAGDRVVLTVTCFDQQALDAITSDPNAPTRLSAALIAAIEAKNLDGVNIDFEGRGSADRAGLTSLVTQVSAALHATNPHWQVTMATYASAAGDSAGFYDIAALAPAVDAFFVMAYDMNDRSQPSATSPLTGAAFNDLTTLEQYTAVVPPSKIVLGVPFYGYDWPTTDGSATAQATGPPSPLSYATIAAAGHPTYWDPGSQTAWTSYQVGTQWHETFFDDPTSLALKAQLAAWFHIAGLGIWALGMDGNDPAMLAALLGNAPPAKDLPAGPPPPAGTGFTTLATFHGQTGIPLVPIAPPASGPAPLQVGTLDGIGTTDPALACLQTGPALPVYPYPSLPGVYVVVATGPADCAVAQWMFAAPPPGAPPTPTTTSAPTTSTTTTTPPTPTTTPSTAPPPTTSTTTTSTTSPPPAPAVATTTRAPPPTAASPTSTPTSTTSSAAGP